jgi:hypothetical protein
MTVAINVGVRDELTEEQAVEYGLKLANLILTERKDRLATSSPHQTQPRDGERRH